MLMVHNNTNTLIEINVVFEEPITITYVITR